MNIVDRTILALFPRWGCRRLEARWIARSYDSSVIDRTKARAVGRNIGPREEARNSRGSLLNAARDLDRNNAFAHGIFNSLVDNVVGEGIRIDARLRTRGGRLLEAKNEAIEDAFNEWAEGCDTTGRLTLFELQRMIERELWVAGECIVVNELATDKRRVKLALSVVESERLAPVDTGTSETPRENTVVQGVEYNRAGVVIAYHLYRGHPTDSLDSIDIVRVPASRVLHLFHTRRPGEVRGVSRTAAVASSFSALNQYLDFELTKARISSAWAMMIIRKRGRGGFALPTTGDAADAQDAVGNDLGEIAGGMMYVGQEGDDIKSVGPSITSNAFVEFVKVILRQVASGLNVSYEMLSRDFSGHNFSSLRQSLLEDRRHWRCRQRFLVERFCAPVWRWFTTWAAIDNLAPFPTITEQQARQVSWIVPGWEWVDPKKDIEADILAIQSGLKSARRCAAAHGGDVTENIRELAQLAQEASDAGVELTLFGGTTDEPTQATGPSEEPEGTPEDVEEEAEAAAV